MGNAYRILFGKNEGERSRGEKRCVDGSIMLNWVGPDSVHWTALLEYKTSPLTISGRTQQSISQFHPVRGEGGGRGLWNF
jgi:hypothetical protein